MNLDYYLGLHYTIELRKDEDGDWIARIKELKGCTADGPTQADALQDLKSAQAEWLAAAIADGVPIPTPETDEALPSGRWLQRVPRALHRDLTLAAEAEGVSLTQLVVSVLSRYVGSRSVEQPTSDRHRPDSGWDQLLPAASSVWRGSLEMKSPRAYRVLRSMCRRLPTEMYLDPRKMEEEHSSDVYANRR